MRVLQFAFGRADSLHLPHTAPRDVVYTGTHDNDTVARLVRDAPESVKQRRHVPRPRTPRDDLAGSMIRAAYGSVADDAIVPLQDVLGLGSEARFNTPAEAEGNWGWRFLPEQVPKELPARLRRLGEVTDRMPLLKSPAAAAGS